jgi:alpha-tubulin suppressor-like RCC1 family protein
VSLAAIGHIVYIRDVKRIALLLVLVCCGLDLSSADVTSTDAGVDAPTPVVDAAPLQDTSVPDADASGPLVERQRLAVGTHHTCAIDKDDIVKCWGANGSKQLGVSGTDSKVPIAVAGLAAGVLSVVAGQDHSCALTADRSVKCWGSNQFGQLGDGTTTNSATPVDVTGLQGNVTNLSVGKYHGCAVADTGAVRCWGLNTKGHLGDGTKVNRLEPVQTLAPDKKVVQVTAGQEHGCARTAQGALLCWGSNASGQGGDGTDTQRLTPVPVTGLGTGARWVGTGYSHTCAIADTGTTCWGTNYQGELGIDSMDGFKLVPTAVVGLGAAATRIVPGAFTHTCAVVSGTVKCWGGGLGVSLTPGTAQSRKPIDIVGISDAEEVGGGDGHFCARKRTGEVLCWGVNSIGELGDNTTSVVPRLNPMPVVGL